MDHEAIARLATLARLTISPEEGDRFAAQLTDILQYVDQIQAVDTTGVADAAHPIAQAAAMREDIAVPSLDNSAGLANAPDADRSSGLFRVPRVMS